jgi:hypothetical protein
MVAIFLPTKSLESFPGTLGTIEKIQPRRPSISGKQFGELLFARENKVAESHGRHGRTFVSLH